MILNTGKCHYKCIGKNVADSDTSQISSQYPMSNSKEEVEILGIAIDMKLTNTVKIFVTKQVKS